MRAFTAGFTSVISRAVSRAVTARPALMSPRSAEQQQCTGSRLQAAFTSACSARSRSTISACPKRAAMQRSVFWRESGVNVSTGAASPHSCVDDLGVSVLSGKRQVVCNAEGATLSHAAAVLSRRRVCACCKQRAEERGISQAPRDIDCTSVGIPAQRRRLPVTRPPGVAGVWRMLSAPPRCRQNHTEPRAQARVR